MAGPLIWLADCTAGTTADKRLVSGFADAGSYQKIRTSSDHHRCGSVAPLPEIILLSIGLSIQRPLRQPSYDQGTPYVSRLPWFVTVAEACRSCVDNVTFNGCEGLLCPKYVASPLIQSPR